MLEFSSYTFTELNPDEFKELYEKSTGTSFMQTLSMSEVLIERGWKQHYLGVKREQELILAALLVSKPMVGGKHYELQFGPIHEVLDECAETFFYYQLKKYVQDNRGLELLIIPNVDYQTFNNKGESLSEANNHFLKKMENIGYTHIPFERGYNQRGESIWHYVKDLSKINSPENLFKSYSKEGKYSVKKTWEFGIKVRKMSFDELDEFTNITITTAEKRGYKPHDLSYHEAIYKHFGERAKFLVAEMNFKNYQNALHIQLEELYEICKQLSEEIAEGDSAKKKKQRNSVQKRIEPLEQRLYKTKEYVKKYGNQDVKLAAALFIYGSSEIVYLSSGSYDEFKTFYAPFALQHYIMQEAVMKSIPSYNFFGIQGVFDGSDGVMRFKENFSGHIVEKIGYFYYYPHPVKYHCLHIMKDLINKIRVH